MRSTPSPGSTTLTSTSTEGVSLVVAQFALEVEADQAVAGHQREAVVGAARPATGYADPRSARRIPTRRRSSCCRCKGPSGLPTRELTRFADKQVKQRIERLSGVGQVTILGGQERQINVELDPIRLAAAGVSALEVQPRDRDQQRQRPGRPDRGRPDQPHAPRRRPRARGRSDRRDRRPPAGRITPIRVRDVADVIDSDEDAETSASRNGAPAIALSVRKQSGSNTVAVVDLVKVDRRRDADAACRRTTRSTSSATTPTQIRTSASQVLEHLVIGSLLAALVVLLFLGSLRSTIIAAISIPVSIIATFGLMMVAGFTLNLMTLLALALAVGIVIDDAIVVLENIHRYIHDKQMKPFQAAVAATKEIGLAVLATTLSLMAVFLPVAFMSGIVGRFLLSFGLTMAFAIGVSMIVAFTLTPLMASRMLRAARGRRRAPRSRCSSARATSSTTR